MAENDKSKLEYFKKKILEILEEKEREGAEADAAVKKALDKMEEVSKSLFFETMGSIEKSGKFGLGAVRVWRGKKYKKVSVNPSRWVRYYDKVDRGAKNSMTRLKNKVKECKTVEALYQFCLSNHAIFKDANGVDLPIVDELRKAKDEKLKELENNSKVSESKNNNSSPKKENDKEKEKRFKAAEENFKNALNAYMNGSKEEQKKYDELLTNSNQYPFIRMLENGEYEKFAKETGIPLPENYKKKNDKSGYVAKLRNQLKEELKGKLGNVENESEHISANLSNKSLDKMTSDKAIEKSKNNGFTVAEHFELVKNIVELFKKALLLKRHKDNKKVDLNLEIERYINKNIALSTGKKADAYITVKHTLNPDGRKIYSLEALDVKKPLQKQGRVTNSLENSSRQSASASVPQTDKKSNEFNANSEKKSTEDEIEQSKADMKKWSSMWDKYVTDWDSGIVYKFNRSTNTNASKDVRAFQRAEGLESLLNLNNELKEMGLKPIEIPADIQKKFDAYKEALGENWSRTWTHAKDDVTKLLTGISRGKFDEISEQVKDLMREEYNKAKEKNPEEKDNTNETNPPVAGKTNKEHAELFTVEKGDDGDDVLLYNGKKFGDGTINFYNNLGSQRELIENAGMNPQSQIDWLLNEENKNPSYAAWSIDSAIKKRGEKAIKEIANTKLISDEEFREKLINAANEKQRDRGWLQKEIYNHSYNKYFVKKAKERLEEMNANNDAISGVDLPVDPEDMKKAKKIIDFDVKMVRRAALKDKIMRRVRNEPALARAMLVYIKQEQEKTGKTIFTSKNEIWNLLPKLNENAMNAVMKGKSETNKTSDGKNMYSGEGVNQVVEDKETGRYQVFFNGKPSAEIRGKLKSNGFRWAPSIGAWQCYNTANGEKALARVAEDLGWKKN